MKKMFDNNKEIIVMLTLYIAFIIILISEIGNIFK